MAQDNRIELVIEGLPEDKGRVRLSVFTAQLQSLNAALINLDRDTNEGRSGSIFEIAALSYASPVRVALEPRPIASERFTGPLVVERLKSVASALEAGSDLSGVDVDLLDNFRALARPVGRAIQNATLVFNGHVLELTPHIVQRVDDALAVEDESEGFIEGMLEQINIHSGANIFHVYPEVGPKRVTCHFPAHLYDDAVTAVGRKVEVLGTLKYRMGASFPHQIAVASIEIFPVADDLPDWEDLRGRAPGATGELSSEAFVRELRDAWE